jgi:hypothetical protein
MMSLQLAKSILYASCQQFFDPVILFCTFSSSFTPRGSLALSTVKSATTPSSSTIGARSLEVDEEKMFHEEQLLLRGKIHRNAKISSTFLVMMQLATARSSLTEVHL